MEYDLPLSVIVPIRNGEKYLRQCLDSIVGQTWKDFELILVDNASTDDSLSICEEYAKYDCRIKIIQEVVPGLIVARMAGLKAAKGKYIGFVDCDDWIEPQMYEDMLKECVNQDLDMITTDSFVEDPFVGIYRYDDGLESGIYEEDGIIRDIYPRMMSMDTLYQRGILPNLCFKLIRKELLDEAYRTTDTRILYAEDAVVTYAVLLRCRKIEVTHKAYYHYIQYPDSVIHRKKNGVSEGNERFYHCLYEKFSAHEQRDVLLKQLKIFMVGLEFYALKNVYDVDVLRLLDFVFPFSERISGKKIVIYGAGRMGKSYYRQIENDGKAKVVCWVDKNYSCMDDVCGMKINPPEILETAEYDWILLALSRRRDMEEVKAYLNELGVDEDKVLWEPPKEHLNWDGLY